MTDAIADWAKIAAYREAYKPKIIDGAYILSNWSDYNGPLIALARRIQRDDKPPVDPLLIEARKLAGAFWRSQGNRACAERVESGDYDRRDSAQAAYKYLKEKQNG